MTGAPNPEIDHLIGARGILKGVDGYAGEWFCVPLSRYLHRIGEYPHSVQTLSRRGFERHHEMSFKKKWIELIAKYEKEFGTKPMSEEEYEIILERGL